MAMPRREHRRGLLDQFEGVFDDPFAVDDIRNQCDLAGPLDGGGDHILVFFAVSGQAPGHDLVALGEAVFEQSEVFVVDEFDFLLAVAAVAFAEFSSFGHVGVS